MPLDSFAPFVGAGGCVSLLLVAHYRQCASAGLIIAESTTISPGRSVVLLRLACMTAPTRRAGGA